MLIRVANLFAQLRRDERAIILVEFAYSLPILMALAFTAIEIANFAIANMRVSQIAMTVADNLSRAKQSVPLGLPQLREADINDAMLGAQIQGANGLPILTNGRVVVSSLQRNGDGNQTITWQRCKGELRNANSSYGAQGATQGTTPNFTGMGNPTLIQAPAGSAIIFAEVTYNYVPLVGGWVIGPRTIRREAAYFVRDDRDLTQVYNPTPAATVSDCGTYSSTFT